VIYTTNIGTCYPGVYNDTFSCAGIGGGDRFYAGTNSGTWSCPNAGINTGVRFYAGISGGTWSWPLAGINTAICSTGTNTYYFSASSGGTTAVLANVYENMTRQLTPEKSFEYFLPTASRLEGTKLARHSIEEFGNLSENWDGYGASSISAQARGNANHFIEVIEAAPLNMPVPEISPQPSGTISFEWETPYAEVYLEIGNTLYSGFIKTDDEEPLFLQGQADSLDQQIVALMQSAIAGPFAYPTPTITEIRVQPEWHERVAA
jgi:hypothetical protein